MENCNNMIRSHKMAVAVYILSLLFVDVKTQSTLGREFSVYIVAHHSHFKECTVSFFTHNFDVKVHAQRILFRSQVLKIEGPYKKVVYGATKITNFTYEPISVERHMPEEIVIPRNRAADWRLLETYLLLMKGNADYGVSVLYVGTDSATSMYTAIPARAYGHYFNIYFLKSKQYYQVHSTRPGGTVFMQRDEKTAQNRPVGSVEIVNGTPSRGAYDCHYTEYDDRRSVRGHIIASSEPMVVTAGNCNSKTDGLKNCLLSSDSAMDVLLPRKFAAKEFIAFDVGAESNDVARVAVIGLFGETLVRVYSTDADFEELTVAQDKYKEVDLKDKEFQLINASKVIQVHLVSQSTCLNDGGSPSFTMLIPNLLFFNHYMWSIPYNRTKCDHNFLILIRKNAVEEHDFVYDNNQINIPSWTSVKGYPSHSGTHYPVTPDESLHTLISGTNRPFACYLYGRGMGRSYLHFAGFMVAKVDRGDMDQPSDPGNKTSKPNKYVCEVSNMTVGDLRDNDCDGRIDEESSTTSDDDEDSQTGEDVIAYVPEYFSKFTQPVTKPPLDADSTLLRTSEYFSTFSIPATELIPDSTTNTSTSERAQTNTTSSTAPPLTYPSVNFSTTSLPATKSQTEQRRTDSPSVSRPHHFYTLPDSSNSMFLIVSILLLIPLIVLLLYYFLRKNAARTTSFSEEMNPPRKSKADPPPQPKAAAPLMPRASDHLANIRRASDHLSNSIHSRNKSTTII